MSRRPLLDFFSRCLVVFQRSGAKFQVVCSVAPTSHGGQPAATQSPAPTPPQRTPRTLIVLDSSFNPPTIAHLRMATATVRDLTEQKGQQLHTIRLLLLLAVNNADKAPKPAAFEQRLAMMWAFARDIQRGLADGHQHEEAKPQEAEQREETQKGLSIDVALSTQPYFNDKSAAIAESGFYQPEAADGEMEQVILAGFDTLIRIFNPKYYGPPTSVGEVASTSTPIQRALDPFFARARLRITMRTDDEWGGKDEQLAYLRDVLSPAGLEKLGGSVGWGSRVQMVEGRKDGEEVVSSTYARDAAKNGDWAMLGRMVTPEVRSWIEGEGLYRE
ncbi:hypothetical protein B0T22DRAFT_501381 [Podospora appendiculata]|uniref:Nicotinamide-nucleotide adenylyltransferase n=1 Tax=Podospora appendiculata TaxID=314037 RepID=A0AAE0X3J9_9PEZI|nr:hypothetical protein B0T22DRAFT_501381 [Podospora appendiculata]